MPWSGSVRVAVSWSPTWGLLSDRVTVPGSSTLVTVTVTAWVEDAEPLSVARIVPVKV